jgi:cytochrome c oxidase assembly protein Cox11
MNSVRSVSNENNAIHIASSIEGIWQVAPLGSPITMPNIITNLAISSSANSTYYFDEFGEPLANSTGATLKMNYKTAVSSGNSTTVNMTFSWPPGAASTNYQTIREFSYTISK